MAATCNTITVTAIVLQEMLVRIVIVGSDHWRYRNIVWGITTKVSINCWNGYSSWSTRGRSWMVVVSWVSLKVTSGRTGRERRVSCNNRTSTALVTTRETATVRCWDCGIRVGGKRKIGRREVRIWVKIQDVGFVSKYLVRKNTARKKKFPTIEIRSERQYFWIRVSLIQQCKQTDKIPRTK